MHKERGVLLVVSGPSGVGKGSVCAALIAMDEQTTYSVSATTRAPRRGEVDGVNYYYISAERFAAKIAAGDFLEYATVYGNYYGTPRAEVERLLAAGKNVILEIDTQGAMQVKAACPQGVLVFILPPSIEELRRRITARGSETPESLNLRLSRAEAEMAMAEQYDYRVVNSDIETAAAELLRIINEVKASRRKGSYDAE
ncbi:MAG: guanylate kinase [Bacillota bacterium]|nr:guanylate kinase [Bacillota bacterium]